MWVLIQGKGQSFFLCNTYRSDYSDNQYWTRLKHAIEMAFEINPNVVITGDTNSDLFNTQNNKLSEIMTLFNFKNVINKPTGITAHSSTLLDHIIISDTMSSIYQMYLMYRLKYRIMMLLYHTLSVLIVQRVHSRENLGYMTE
jgi:hypothetical protein